MRKEVSASIFHDDTLEHLFPYKDCSAFIQNEIAHETLRFLLELALETSERHMAFSQRVLQSRAAGAKFGSRNPQNFTRIANGCPPKHPERVLLQCKQPGGGCRGPDKVSGMDFYM